MSQTLCPQCRQMTPADVPLCRLCAALLPSPATVEAPRPAGGVTYEKAGFGAMGNVDIRHDASSNHSQTHTVHDHSVHITHQHAPLGSGAPAATHQTVRRKPVLVIVIPLTVGLAGLGGFLWWAVKHKSSSGSDAPPAGQINVNPVIQPVINITNGDTSPVQPGALPAISSAEVGKVVAGQFVAQADFKTGDLLTVRVRVDRPCHLRALYLPAQGDPVRMFPERDGSSDLAANTSALLIPDPVKLRAATPDCTAFQLFHDTGRGPPIREQILVQVLGEPFTDEGSTRGTNSPYRTYDGLTLAQVRSRGVTRLQGLSAAEAQSRADEILSERILSFTIRP